MSAVTRTKFFVGRYVYDTSGHRAVRRQEVDGWTIGPFGVHRHEGGWWIVTHLPTGFEAFERTTRRAAINDAIRASEIPFDWLRPSMSRFGQRPPGRVTKEAERKLRAIGVLP